MAASISAMIHVFETKIQEKNLQLIKKYDSSIPKVLVGDPVRLHQIILNLVSNAVKFTNEGQITVSVRLLNQDEEKVMVEFSITDTGIGIAKEKIAHIFENFQQATSETSRLYGGTGLGLAIAKQLVESQGGIITVKSKLKKGSTFSFVLPFFKTKILTESEKESIELNEELKNMKVLVVEDIALNQLLMKTLLDDFGFKHEIAGNGKIAIEKLKNNVFDVILMDLQMPEMNGFEAAKYIRSELNLQIPIIALTADVTTADLERCTAAGMNDYISKPIDERLLYNKIAVLLKKTSRTSSAIIPVEEVMYTDLAYLTRRTKADPSLMKEMITLYLEQTPSLISTMNQSLLDKDWDALCAAAHKMIPSFSIVGIHKDYEDMAKKIQEYTSTKQHLDEVKGLVLQVGKTCSQACKELEEAFNLIKN